MQHLRRLSASHAAAAALGLLGGVAVLVSCAQTSPSADTASGERYIGVAADGINLKIVKQDAQGALTVCVYRQDGGMPNSSFNSYGCHPLPAS